MRRRALLTATALLPSLGCVRDGGRPIKGVGITPPDAAFLASLEALLDSAGVPGIAMGVVSRGRVVWECHAGVIDQNAAAVGPATIWKAASLSKQVSTYAALRLVGAGALALDRPLAFYLGDDAPSDTAAQRITARHVLTHSSGLPNWRRTGDLIAQFAPGTGFLYSGEGYFLLARCIERITGMGFEAHMQQAVFRPLGMDSSSFLWRADLATRLTPGHRWQGVAWDDAAWRDGLHARMLASTVPVARWTLDRIASEMAPTSGPEQGVPLLPGAISYPNPAMSLKKC